MKKLFCICALCLMTAVLVTSCGGPSWNQERAKELNSIPTEDVTPQQFDEMLDLLEAGWELCKQQDEDGNLENETEEEADKRREFVRTFFALEGSLKSVAHARKRVVSDDQVKKYETLIEKIKNETIEISRKNAEKYK